MPARPITRELYERVLAFYRENPGRITACARMAGVRYETARRMWKGPQHTLWPWLIPAQIVIAQEKRDEEERRATEQDVRRLEMQKQSERARRIEEAAHQFEEQAMVVARADIIHGLAALNQLTKGVTTLAKRINMALETGTAELSVQATLNLIKSYTSSVKGLTDAAETLVNLARVQRDLPTQIVGLDIASVSVADAQREVEFAQRALERAKTLGLSVVDGGRNNRR